MTLSVTQCREILGAEADGKSDEQIEKLHDSIAALANSLYDQVQAEWKANPESVRWAAYSHENGEESDTHDYEAGDAQ
jgi:hypothetical protein